MTVAAEASVSLDSEAGDVRFVDAPFCSCGRRGRPVHAGLRDRFFNVPGAWGLARCDDCQLLWVTPRPLPADLWKLYREYYTHGATSAVSGRRRFLKAVKREALSRRLGYGRADDATLMTRVWGGVAAMTPGMRRRLERDVMYVPPVRDGRLLDVGCGDGSFLAQMRALGWNVAGIEPDASAALRARERLHASVHAGAIDDAPFDHGSFDAITLCHVIEHVPDADAVLQRCRELVKPGGVVVIATPNASALGHRLLGAHWRELDPPRHLTLFTARSLGGAVTRAGLDVQRIVSSSQNAADIWASSRQIQQLGRMQPAAVPARLKAEGRAFRLLESLTQACVRAPVSEELTVIARRR